MYNCSILDLYDRSIIASKNSNNITSQVAIDTLNSALKSNIIESTAILHSDQGRQFSSKEFIEFCEKNQIIQSMSKAGCPYDNSPMESFFSKLKNEHLNQYIVKTEKDHIVIYRD